MIIDDFFANSGDFLQTCIDACMDARMDVCMYACMYACMEAVDGTNKQISSSSFEWWSSFPHLSVAFDLSCFVAFFGLYGFVHECKYGCMHGCMHATMHASMHSSVYASMHASMYVFMFET